MRKALQMKVEHMHTLGRRGLVRGIIATSAIAGLPLASARAAAATVRWNWWGNPERDRRTAQAIKLYLTQHPDMKLIGEAAAWPDYWPKLATQVAGRSAPDVIQMDYRYLVEYARRGALAPLDSLIPTPLDLTGFAKAETEAGTVAGKIYGVSVGANAFAVHYDTALFRRLGVPDPKAGWTWSDFVDTATAISKASPKGFYGAADGSRQDDVLERFLRQHDKAYFTVDGQQLGFAPDDVAAFFAFWDDLRKRGVVTPAEVTATDQRELNTSMLTTGKAAMAWHHANQLPGVQGLMSDPVALATFPAPAAGQDSGNYLKPSQLMSIYARSGVQQQAADVLRFMIADPQGAAILGIERGVPESEAVRAKLTPGLKPLDAAVVRYVDIVGQSTKPLPPSPPKGGGVVNLMVPRIADKVAFGQITAQQGGQEFHDSLAMALKRA
jgi:multiple sugar transport system substrate-binding protein